MLYRWVMVGKGLLHFHGVYKSTLAGENLRQGFELSFEKNI